MALITQQQIENVMNQVVERFMIPYFKDKGMNASGNWLNETHGEAESDNKGLIVGPDYTYYLAHGRKGGTMPPHSAMLRYVQVKWGLGGQEAENAAWALAMKIKQEGTRYYPQGTDILKLLKSDEVVEYVQERFKEIIRVRTQEELIKTGEKL